MQPQDGVASGIYKVLSGRRGQDQSDAWDVEGAANGRGGGRTNASKPKKQAKPILKDREETEGVGRKCKGLRLMGSGDNFSGPGILKLRGEKSQDPPQEPTAEASAFSRGSRTCLQLRLTFRRAAKML